jgi:hypothetical protein
MDPVASGLTILSTVRKAVTLAKKLYDAPRELEELQVEIETFKSVLNDVIVQSLECRITSRALDLAIGRTQSCLLEIQQLVEYKLIKEVPEGKKAKRGAWLRKAAEVHDLLEKLGECRANVILAFAAARSTTERRSEATLREISQSLLDFRADFHRNQNLFVENWRRWETHMATIESQLGYSQRLCHLLETAFSTGNSVFGPPPISYRPDDRLLRDSEEQELLLDTGDKSAKALAQRQCPTLTQSQHLRERTTLSSLEGRRRIVTFRGQRRKLPRLPTRVLDLGNESAGTRLREFTGGERDRYVAMSYSLGHHDLLPVQVALLSRREIIPLSAQPLMIQNIVTVSRRLGIRYVWVDALCTSAREWARGSSEMLKILRNATMGVVVMPAAFVSWPTLLPRYRGEEETLFQR